jgi:hypothetical protein
MKRIINIIFIVMVAICSYAQDATKPYIRTAVKTPESTYYVNEKFPFSFSMTSFKVQLSSNLSISELPVAPYLICSQFFEQPEKKISKDYDVESTKTFQCDAYSSKPGRLIISPTIHMFILQRSRSLFRNWVETPYEQKVSPIILNIKPLPTDQQPKEFSGAIGNFKVSSQADMNDVSINSIIKLKITISGDGYLKNVQPPIIGQNENFKIYNPILLDKQDNKIIYEQTIIPLSEKAHTIPKVSFTFFNPIKEKYDVINSNEIKLTFHKEKKNGNEFETFKPAITSNIVQNTEVEIKPKPLIDPKFSEIIPKDTINITIYAMNGVALLIIIISWMFLSKKRAAITTVLIIILAGSLSIASKKYMTVNEKYPLYIITEQTKAHVAPNSQALKTFQLNKGDHIFLKETYGEWSLIFKNSHYGWIETTSINK